MKFIVKISMEVPNCQNAEDAEELVQEWMSEADYVMRQRHFNERMLPENPCVIDMEQFSSDEN